MDITIQQRIDGYLEVHERVKPVVKDAEIVAAVIEQIGKDARCARLVNGRANGNGNGEQNATEKQIGFLKKLNVAMPAGCTKQEASRLIDQAQAA